MRLQGLLRMRVTCDKHCKRCSSESPGAPRGRGARRARRRSAACTDIARGHPSRRIACAMLIRMRNEVPDEIGAPETLICPDKVFHGAPGNSASRKLPSLA